VSTLVDFGDPGCIKRLFFFGFCNSVVLFVCKAFFFEFLDLRISRSLLLLFLPYRGETVSGCFQYLLLTWQWNLGNRNKRPEEAFWRFLFLRYIPKEKFYPHHFLPPATPLRTESLKFSVRFRYSLC